MLLSRPLLVLLWPLLGLSWPLFTLSWPLFYTIMAFFWHSKGFIYPKKRAMKGHKCLNQCTSDCIDPSAPKKFGFSDTIPFL